MSDYNYGPLEHELAGGTSADEGHTCIDINNKATHQDCEACRTEMLLADETHCTECKRPANTECVEQGHRTSSQDDYDVEQSRIKFQKELTAAMVNAGPKEVELPAPRAGERDNWYLVKLGRNTFIERDRESPFICDMQTYDSSDAERDEARQLAEQIITEHNQHTTLIEQRKRLVQALLEVKAGLDLNRREYEATTGRKPSEQWWRAREPKWAQSVYAVLATIEQEGEA